MSAEQIPDFLAHLPVWQGMPVPFTVKYEVGQVGRPAFEVTDAVKWADCVEKRLCGVCGRELGYWIAFIGGPKSVEGRAFHDPAMHVECAEYSLDVCPYMVGAAGHASEEVLARREERDGVARRVLEHVTDEPPDRVALYVTRRYEVRRYQTRTLSGMVNVVVYLRPAPAKRIEWRGRG